MNRSIYGRISFIELYPCSEEIIAGSVDGTVRRFDARAGCLFTDDLGQSVTSIAISGDNLCVLAACLDGHMRLLDKATGTMLAGYRGRISTEQFSHASVSWQV